MSMGTNYSPLLTDLFPFCTRQTSYRDFARKKKRSQPEPLIQRFAIHNSKFADFVYHTYPIEFEIKYTTDTDRSAAYLDLHLEINGEGLLRTELYDKRDDFNFHIVNFPFICSNIPTAPEYVGIHLSVGPIFLRLWFIQRFRGDLVARSIVFYVVFCRLLFVLLYFFLLSIVMSVLLPLTVSDYSFDIFKLVLQKLKSLFSG